MIICSCNVLTDHDIRSASIGADIKPQSPVQVHICLGCRQQCGRCATSIRRILEDALGRGAEFCVAQGPMMTPLPPLTPIQSGDCVYER